MTLSKFQRYLLSILTGVLLIVSFPFTGSLTPLIFIALVPLLLVEHFLFNKNYKSGKVFIHAYLSFLIYNIGTTWWIWNADPYGAIMAFVLNTLLMATTFWFYHILKKRSHNKFGLLLFVAIWLSFEFFHYHWELSWPWLTFGNVFSIQTSWIQWYEFTGVLGGSLWVLLGNVLIARVIIQKSFNKIKINPRKIAFIALVVIIPIAVSFAIFGRTKIIGKKTEVVVTQPNIDPYLKYQSLSPEEQLYRIIHLANKGITPRTKMVLAPETAIPFSFDEAEVDQFIGYRILRDSMIYWNDVQLFIGASTERKFDTKHSLASRPIINSKQFVEYYNTGILMSPNMSPDFSHKSKLVLGVEKIPFSKWLPFLESWSLDLGGTTGTLGVEKHPKNIQSGFFEFTPSICYESIYGEYTARQTRLGSQAIFIITNDGWWGDTPGYKQHFSFARLRAIENRKDVARSANTGMSGFINQLGQVVKSSDYWVMDVLRHTISLNSKQTFYMKMGDYLGRLAVLITIVLALLALFRFKKS